MKLNEFKKLVRPMIKEMVREVMLEEGMLSNIVAEVASGLVLSETRVKSQPRQDPDLDNYKQDLKKQAMVEQMRKSQPMVFENTRPPAGEPKAGKPLSGADPNDPGVDISSIIGMSNGNWGKLI